MQTIQSKIYITATIVHIGSYYMETWITLNAE